MALLRCYHCQRPVARFARMCPNCGGAINEYHRGAMHARGFVDAEGNPAAAPGGCAIFLYIVGGSAIALLTLSAKVLAGP